MDYLPLPMDIIADPRTYYRMWGRIDKLINPPCWIWTGGHTGENVAGRRCPIFKIKFINYPATRVMYAIHYCIPNKDHPSCINPDHLWLGTVSENINDYFERGGVPSYGRSFFNDSEIRLIRNLFHVHNISIQDLVKRFGTNRQSIHKIVYYKSYLHVKD
jgi:hypothetical protein